MSENQKFKSKDRNVQMLGTSMHMALRSLQDSAMHVQAAGGARALKSSVLLEDRVHRDRFA